MCTVYPGDNAQVCDMCTVYPGDSAQVSLTLVSEIAKPTCEKIKMSE